MPDVHPNTALNRKVGWLVNERVATVNGKTGFDCRCCGPCGGNRRLVTGRHFNSGSVLACRTCTKNRVAPKRQMAKRVAVTLPEEAMVDLGVDPALARNRSSETVRQLLTDLAAVVGAEAVPLSDDQTAVLRLAVAKAGLPTVGLPTERLRRLASATDDDGLSELVATFTQAQALAVLAELRWGRDHN